MIKLNPVPAKIVSLGISAGTLLIGCGGNVDTSIQYDPNNNPKNNATNQSIDHNKNYHHGKIIPIPIKNIRYETDSLSGFTDSHGQFRYSDGETIRFFIGRNEIIFMEAKEEISPVDFSDSGALVEPYIVNLFLFLDHIDDDGEFRNGITITNAIHESLDSITIDFGSEDFEDEIKDIVPSYRSLAGRSLDSDTIFSHIQNELHIRGIGSLLPETDGFILQYNNHFDSANVNDRTVGKAIEYSYGYTDSFVMGQDNIQYLGSIFKDVHVENYGVVDINVILDIPIIFETDNPSSLKLLTSESAGKAYIDGYPHHAPVAVTGEYSFLGIMPIETDLGSIFSYGIKYQIDLNISNDDLNVPIKSESEVWFSRGVGVVRHIYNGEIRTLDGAIPTLK